MREQPITTMRTIETDRFRVVFDALVEDMAIADAFDDTIYDIEQLVEDVRRHQAVWFTARCRIIHKSSGAVLGSNYLGGCYYESFDDFMEISRAGYVPDMLYEAIGAARRSIDNMQL